MGVILKAENISKQYRLGLVGTGTIAHDLNRFWHRIRGKEDPYLQVGSINDRSAKATEDYVWALQDINFEVEQGEVLGIIGKNGAGKSTLLKLLSRVTSPTTGVIKSNGRIASLLEVGTGFHPELTGRENIFLNGAILGMTKAEISSKIDEIIEFSGCEMYIDTPTKRYSSGMTVRLAFAVAAHLEPDILVIDEVLAVGDAEFQKKAIGKMQDISKGEGRTVLFVSHNMVSVKQLCSKCIVLEKGLIAFEGTVDRGIKHYLSNKRNRYQPNKYPIKTEKLWINNFEIRDTENLVAQSMEIGRDFNLVLLLKNKTNTPFEINVRYQILDENEKLVTTINTYLLNSIYRSEPNEEFIMSCNLKKIPIPPGDYSIGIRLMDYFNKDILFEDDNFEKITINEGDFYNTGRIPAFANMGDLLIDYQWENDTVSF